jgi:hypothetical protein
MIETLMAFGVALGGVAAGVRAPALPSWFLGAWEREWIRRAGVTSSTMTVRFLQTPTMFGDLRIPLDRPKFPHARSLADLTDAELATLAGQRGFFGHTTVAGDIATWHHEIDYQPPDGQDDVGRIERLGTSGMLEHALDASYVERWWPLSSGDGKFLAVRVTRLEGGVQRLDRVLLVAGDHFVYARNRSKDLPVADSLADLFAKTHATRETVLGYLDCELSHGYVRGGSAPWTIFESTLPWREGSRLDFAGLISVDSAWHLSATAAPGETWAFPVNTLTPEDLGVLFPAARN